MLHEQVKDRGVLLFSGGLDSVLSAVLLAEERVELTALILDYPGRPEGERIACSHLVQLLPFTSVSTIGISSCQPLSLPQYRDTVYEGWIPYRNLLIWSLASHYAGVIAASFVAAGHDDDDMAKYSDVSTDFFRLLESILHYSGGPLEAVAVRLPLLSLPEDVLVKKAAACRPLLEKSWSCWRNATVPCSKCSACIERELFLAQVSSSSTN